MLTTRQNIIQTHALSFSFGKRQVLKSIELQVPEGCIFGFLGPNGAGKSTTIKTLLGLLHTENGMIEIFGKELNSNKMYILERIGAMVESPSLYDHLDASRNLGLTARLRNLPLTRIPELLDAVGLTADAHRPVKQYSNGIMEMRLLLQRINQQHNCTILLSSHILSEIEKLCTDVAIINSGSLVYQGTMQSLLSAATGKEVIIIHTVNLEKARKIIDGRFAAIEKDNKLLVTVNQKSEAAFVIRTLVENGIDIYSAGLETTGLEASFLHLLNDNHKS